MKEIMHSKCCEKGYISGFKNGFKQYLGSGSGSIGSARFWLPGSGSAKIWTFEKSEIMKISLILNGSSSFRIKISKKTKTFKIIFCSKNSVNLKEMTWIRILTRFLRDRITRENNENRIILYFLYVIIPN